MKLPKTRTTINPPKKAVPKALPKALPKATPKAAPVKAAPPKAIRKPAPPKKAPEARPKPPVEKEVVTYEETKIETAVATLERPSEEAPEPVVAAERERPASEPRPADSVQEQGQTTVEALTKLEYNQLYPLWKRLNKGVPDGTFVTLRKQDDLPKTRYMRKAEAMHRGTIPASPPVRGAYYCPYCMIYMPFHNDTYMGYTRCCGCGISTKDYHTRGDNPHAD